jgi:C-terminal processing protease CtpA/Prc
MLCLCICVRVRGAPGGEGRRKAGLKGGDVILQVSGVNVVGIVVSMYVNVYPSSRGAVRQLLS